VGRPPLLSRVAARARRALGMDDVARRLDTIEAGLATLHADRYPNGPLYFGDHTALVSTRWGVKMLVDTRDAAIAPWIVLDGLWETHVTDWLQETLRPGQMFVDVGANVGYFTLLGAKLVGPQGRVVAVEAHPGLAELLRRFGDLVAMGIRAARDGLAPRRADPPVASSLAADGAEQ